MEKEKAMSVKDHTVEMKMVKDDKPLHETGYSDKQILTQFRYDLFYADLAPLHQVLDSVKALTIGLLGFLEAEQK